MLTGGAGAQPGSSPSLQPARSTRHGARGASLTGPRRRKRTRRSSDSGHRSHSTSLLRFRWSTSLRMTCRMSSESTRSQTHSRARVDRSGNAHLRDVEPVADRECLSPRRDNGHFIVPRSGRRRASRDERDQAERPTRPAGRRASSVEYHGGPDPDRPPPARIGKDSADDVNSSGDTRHGCRWCRGDGKEARRRRSTTGCAGWPFRAPLARYW
jgi:hypothetical protein